jgi:hypothetical protein
MVKFSPTKHVSIDKMMLIPNTTISSRFTSPLAPETHTIREIIEKSELFTNLKKTQYFVTFRYLQLVETVLFEDSVKN